MLTKEACLGILKKEPIKNANIINFIENYDVVDFIAIGDAVLAKGVSDRPWVYLSASNTAELESLMPYIGANDHNFAVVEEWMMPILTKGRKVLWTMPIMKLYLPDSVDIEAEIESITGPNYPSPLTLADAEHVFMNSDYQAHLTIPYVQERIINGFSMCAREQGAPVAWAMTHDDGAIGFLHVMPESRKKGYAMIVTRAMIRQLRNHGKLPFVHIEATNEKSMNLAKKTGFVEDRIILWFSLK